MMGKYIRRVIASLSLVEPIYRDAYGVLSNAIDVILKQNINSRGSFGQLTLVWFEECTYSWLFPIFSLVEDGDCHMNILGKKHLHAPSIIASIRVSHSLCILFSALLKAICSAVHANKEGNPQATVNNTILKTE